MCLYNVTITYNIFLNTEYKNGSGEHDEKNNM